VFDEVNYRDEYYICKVKDSYQHDRFLPCLSETAHGPDAAAVVKSGFYAKEQIMSDSTLDPDNIPVGTDRTLGRGHGTRALGPSDNSDSGSDVAGDPDISFDSDTDAEGTGERAEVELELVAPDADIGFDHVETIPVVDGEFRDAAPAEEEQEEGEREPLREERRDWSRTSSRPSSRP
jgi:hypothetical protein